VVFLLFVGDKDKCHFHVMNSYTIHDWSVCELPIASNTVIIRLI